MLRLKTSSIYEEVYDYIHNNHKPYSVLTNT